jgi:hypothetical protein
MIWPLRKANSGLWYRTWWGRIWCWIVWKPKRKKYGDLTDPRVRKIFDAEYKEPFSNYWIEEIYLSSKGKSDGESKS